MRLPLTLARVLVVAIAIVARPAHATPSQELDRAREAFRRGQFELAQPLYNDLLYPNPQLASADDLTEAHVALGVCRFSSGDVESARSEFEKALQLDPNRQLDPLMITDKGAIRLFDDTKTEIKVRAEREAARKQHAKDVELREQLLKSTVIVESHSRVMEFLPFGAGQYQNGDTTKAILLLAGEGVTAGTSLIIWGYLVDTYGLNNQHLHVDTNEAQNIRTLQEIEIVSGAAFIGLAIYGAIDSVRHFRPETRRKAELSDLPRIDDKPLPAPKPPAKPTSMLDRIHLTPMITPSGAGIGLAWEQ